MLRGARVCAGLFRRDAERAREFQHSLAPVHRTFDGLLEHRAAGDDGTDSEYPALYFFEGFPDTLEIELHLLGGFCDGRLRLPERGDQPGVVAGDVNLDASHAAAPWVICRV